jgi:hypothetical protein
MTGTMPNQFTPVTPVEPPRRKAGARLSGGHLIMIVSGLAAFVLVLALFGRGDATVTVAVATETIEADTQVTRSVVKPVKVAKDSPLLPGLVAYDTIKAETRYATTRIDEGTPIAKAQLTPQREAVDGVIAREISLKVDAGSAAGGKIAKGDRVDVIGVSSDGVACRLVSGVRVTNVSSGSGGALTSGGDMTITFAMVNDGDDLKIASLSGKKAQIVLATGQDDVTSGPACASEKTVVR